MAAPHPEPHTTDDGAVVNLYGAIIAQLCRSAVVAKNHLFHANKRAQDVPCPLNGAPPDSALVCKLLAMPLDACNAAFESLCSDSEERKLVASICSGTAPLSALEAIPGHGHDLERALLRREVGYEVAGPPHDFRVSNRDLSMQRVTYARSIPCGPRSMSHLMYAPSGCRSFLTPSQSDEAARGCEAAIRLYFRQKNPWLYEELPKAFTGWPEDGDRALVGAMTGHSGGSHESCAAVTYIGNAVSHSYRKSQNRSPSRRLIHASPDELSILGREQAATTSQILKTSGLAIQRPEGQCVRLWVVLKLP
jgi:hypothetical protein